MVLALALIGSGNALDNHTVAPKDHKFYDHDPPEKLIASSISQDPDCLQNQQWFCFNSTAKSYSCLYGYDTHLKCSENGPLIKLGYCATYSEDTGLITVTKCPYFQMNGYNVTIDGSQLLSYIVLLPKSLAELNDSMCGPMNRKGIACSQCIDGYGPSVTSIGYRCINCTDAWYRVPLFLVFLFAPITLFIYSF